VARRLFAASLPTPRNRVTEFVHIITRLDTVPMLGASLDKFVGDVEPFKL
jgi:hypothetical protein